MFCGVRFFPAVPGTPDAGLLLLLLLLHYYIIMTIIIVIIIINNMLSLVLAGGRILHVTKRPRLARRPVRASPGAHCR